MDKTVKFILKHVAEPIVFNNAIHITYFFRSSGEISEVCIAYKDAGVRKEVRVPEKNIILIDYDGEGIEKSAKTIERES